MFKSKKFITALLTAAMIFTQLPATDYAKAEETPTEGTTASQTVVLPTVERDSAETIYATTGQSVTMKVNTGYEILEGEDTKDFDISYEWYKGSNKLAETKDTLTISEVGDDFGSYTCEVKYSSKNENVTFFDTGSTYTVSISFILKNDTNITLNTPRYNVYHVEDGKDVTLSVDATTPSKSITYQWSYTEQVSYYNETYATYYEIDDATKSNYTYTFDETETLKAYKCVITCGDNSKVVYFIPDYLPYYVKRLGYSTRTLRIGDDTILQVLADMGTTGYSATYEWKKETEEGSSKTIEGATSDTYKLNIKSEDDFGKYTCTVTIKDSNNTPVCTPLSFDYTILQKNTSANTYFDIVSKNQLGQDCQKFDEGENAYLSINTDYDILEYKWIFQDVTGSYSSIDCTEDNYVLQNLNIDDKGSYYIYAKFKNEEGEIKSVSSSVYISVNEIDSKVTFTYPKIDRKNVGDSITLYCDAVHNKNYPLTYQWFYTINKKIEGGSIRYTEDIKGATSKSFTIDEITEEDFDKDFYCRVSDGENEYTTSGYYINKASSDFKLSVKENTFVYAKLNTTCTFSAVVTATESSNITYKLVKDDSYTVRTSTNNVFAINIDDVSDYGQYKLEATNGNAGDEIDIFIRPDYQITFDETDTAAKTEYGYISYDNDGNYIIKEPIINNLYFDDDSYVFGHYSKGKAPVLTGVLGEMGKDSNFYNAKKESFEGIIGSKVTLDASATTDDGSKLSYRWFKIAYQHDYYENETTPVFTPLNETSSKLTITIDDNCISDGSAYICEVISDTSHGFYFADFAKISGLTNAITTDKLVRYTTDGQEITINAETILGEDAKYIWHKVKFNDKIAAIKDLLETIDGQTTASYTYTADKNSMIKISDAFYVDPYYITAYDGYNNVSTVAIVICVDPEYIDGTDSIELELKKELLNIVQKLSPYLSEISTNNDIMSIVIANFDKIFEILDILGNSLCKTVVVEGEESITLNFSDEYKLIPDCLKGFKPYISIIDSEGNITDYGLDGEDIAGKSIDLNGDKATICFGFGSLDGDLISSFTSTDSPDPLLIAGKLIPFINLLTQKVGYMVEATVEEPEETAPATEGSVEPAEETEAPAEETVVPTESSVEPDYTEAPAEETEAAADETEAPADETKAPADETEAPSDETKAPADETKAPADETKAPADETKAPEKNDEKTAPTIINYYIIASPSAVATASAATASAATEEVKTFTYNNAKYKVIGEGKVALAKILKDKKKF
ncbi:MAG: immunoglobulin domain-containing protein, partial [Lachnospiraceae bacterium]|nr:immunoglobulin domain-containing protein [Lachnospiraceae bacterium]